METPLVEHPEDHIANRERIVSAMRAELLGPAPVGDPIDCTGDLVFANPNDAFKPHHELGSGEEILQRDPPRRRYGIGVLFPVGAVDDGEEEVAVSEPREGAPPILEDSAHQNIEALRLRDERAEAVADDEDTLPELDLSGANSYKPTSMAVSFLLDVGGGGSIHLSLRAARYRRKQVTVGERKSAWWIRQSLAFEADIPADELNGQGIRQAERNADTPAFNGLDVRFEVFSRPHGAHSRLLTVCLVNRTPAARPLDALMLFQAGFTVSGREGQNAVILPYPTPPGEALDQEEQSLDLLYRNVQTFGVGHGCSADWVRARVASAHQKSRRPACRCFKRLASHRTSSIPSVEKGFL
jgi:hypothetical protein